MTVKGGSSQACAACKYQRRRCTSTCQLAPYFPADQPIMFRNAHRLFGVSNILKILKQLDPSQKRIAMKSIIYQANARDKYPVYGCLGIIQQLCYQIQVAEEELQAVHSQINLYRQHQQQEISNTLNDSISQLQLGMSTPATSNGFTLFHQEDPQQFDNTIPLLPTIGSHPATYSNTVNPSYTNGYADKESNMAANALWIQEPFNNNNNPMVIQSQLITTTTTTTTTTTAQPEQDIQQEAVQDYDDEMHPFFDIIDDRQSYIDSKEAYESSSESSLKDTTQSVEQVAENELKNAASCFSLTSIN